MKILIIHNILWSHYKAVVFSALGNICQKNDDELLVIQVAESEKGRRLLGASEHALHRYPFKLLFKGDFEDSGLFLRCFKLCCEIIKYQPQVVVLPGYSDFSSWCALLVSYMMRTPRIVTFDSTETDHRRHWHKELIKRFFIKMCNGGFGYGSRSRDYLERLGMHPDNFFIRYQATHNQEIANIHASHLPERDTKLAHLNAGVRNFIYVGRLSPEKNIKLLILAFSKIKQCIPAAKGWGLIIVGDGTLRQELEASNTSNTIFVGGKSWREVVEYYALADVSILPSTSETWGLVVNEAMVCGLPVIVSSNCGSAQALVVEGENGFTFNPYSVDELIARMSYFVEHPERINKMGANSQRIIGDYTPQNAAKQMHQGIHRIFDNEKTQCEQQCT